jgi:putative CocE/NonD family hydrolase
MTASDERLAVASVELQWGIKIPLRDGVHLNATLHLPRSHERPAPTIFTLTPYVAQTYHDRGMYFAAHGYPFLAVDVRGRGNSEGEFRPFINEARDGFDVVEWLAVQPYCNGQVAMWGGSYGGYDQWTTATEFPPHLATIVPVAAPYIGVDFPTRCNIAPPYLMQWLTLVSGRAAQDKIFADHARFWSGQYRAFLESGKRFKDLDVELGNPSPIFQEWVAHPKLDAYWDSYNPTAKQYAKLDIPILTITGSYDSDQPGAIRHYREHHGNASVEARAKHYLVIGPWDHAGTRTPQAEFCGIRVDAESLVDLGKLHLQWYAWTMQHGPKPEFLRNQVAYYVMGAERWRYVDTLEAITSRAELLYLSSDGNPDDVFHSGSLTSAPPPLSSGPDHFVYDPGNSSLAELESTVNPESVVDQRMIHASVGKQLVYHSVQFKEDTEISGFFRLSVWLAIDQPDTDFCVWVYEIDVGGGSILLTTDWLRARHRESLREERLIATKEPLRYEFENFMFISRQVRRGNRLRLVVGPVNSIYAQRNYNSGGVVAEESIKDARTVTVSLFHDEARPSALYVPIGRPDSEGEGTSL